jgi:DNA helicase-2/ATP-dependent DNA helicase PcrA
MESTGSDLHGEEGKPPWLEGVEGDQILPLITQDVPVLRVPAGPGTGKTFGLRKRVLRLLHPDGEACDPTRVLVCAFNRVIANDLRKEIQAELEPFGLESPVVATVHGLAGLLAGERPRYLLPHEIDVMLYDVLESHEAISDEFDGKFAKAKSAMRAHEAGLEDHPALAQVIAQWVDDHRAAMVGDLPRAVERALQSGDYADRRFDHIIIDEFQDLTETEGRLAVGLRAPGARVVALGDKKQSIYAFRGNERRGLDALPELCGEEVVDHQMDECRRCHEEVVKLANEVMARYGEPLVDVRGPGAQVHQVHYNTPGDEQNGLAAEVVRVYKAEPDRRHLVLVTRRRWGYDLREAIRRIDPEVNAQTVFSEDILETWPVREAFIFLEVLASNDDPAALRDWIAYRRPDGNGKNWKAPRRNAAVYRSLRQDGLLTLARLRRVAEGPVNDLSGSGRGEVHERARRLVALLDDVPDGDVRLVVEHVLDADGWDVDQSASSELARHDMERLRREALQMIDEANEDVPLSRLVEDLRSRIATREPIGEEENPGIEIVTLWGAKGLTADFVYILGLCDEALPGPHDEDESGLTAGEYNLEQQRLLYVSLTRAKRALVISRPTKIKRGEVAALGLERRWGTNPWWQDLHVCRFLKDLSRDALPASVSGAEWAGIDLDAIAAAK